ncbi:MAG: putative membrane protein [Patiriisocius sp.]|jgi:putative membrane protein
MMKLVTRILITALALLLVSNFVPGVMVDGLYAALIAALVLGILNVLVKPVLVILTLPITVVTLGLFMFVINAALFMFAASFLDGFAVSGFLAAMLGSLIVSVISSVGNRFIE